jgi:hypothetical protein
MNEIIMAKMKMIKIIMAKLNMANKKKCIPKLNIHVS